MVLLLIQVITVIVHESKQIGTFGTFKRLQNSGIGKNNYDY